MGDWVIRNHSNPIPSKKVQELIKSENVLQACSDIGNSIKHLRIERYSPTTKKVQTSVLSVAGTSSPGSILCVSRGERSIKLDNSEDYEYEEINVEIVMSNGENFGLQEFCEKAISVWREFLKQNGFVTVT